MAGKNHHSILDYLRNRVPGDDAELEDMDEEDREDPIKASYEGGRHDTDAPDIRDREAEDAFDLTKDIPATKERRDAAVARRERAKAAAKDKAFKELEDAKRAKGPVRRRPQQ